MCKRRPLRSSEVNSLSTVPPIASKPPLDVSPSSHRHDVGFCYNALLIKADLEVAAISPPHHVVVRRNGT